MLQLMVVYFGPYYLFRIKVGSSYRLWATFIGFVINYAAYFAEIYRSGIQSMPVGQYEAAEILGYGKAQTFFKIILPQVIKRILPSVTNEVITLVKDTSLAFTLSVAEMFSIAKALAASQTNMMPCQRRHPVAAAHPRKTRMFASFKLPALFVLTFPVQLHI